ncbi:MAG: CPBP family intramembrane metalloprotease [Candidatus Eisenbacteria bacterium]|nr:CPBP family intramembrane metalloprotease [Candidatus Eisenbacteria bacterium]
MSDGAKGKNPILFNRYGITRVVWRALLYPLILGAAVIALGIVFSPLLGRTEFSVGATSLEDIGPGFVLAGYAMLIAALLVAGYVMTRFLDRRPFAGIGLGLHERWGTELGTGLVLGAFFITAVVLLQTLAGSVRLSPAGGDPGGVAARLLVHAAIFVCVAVLEELAFRGYALQLLAEGFSLFGDRAGKIVAALLLSIPFGVTHYFNTGGTLTGALSTGLAGLILSLAYFRTRSLWLPIGMHVTWNFFMAAVYSLPVSGEILPRTPFDASVGGPVWASGGSFGPEGSLFAFLVMIGMAVFLMRCRGLFISEKAAAWFPAPAERTAAKEEEAESKEKPAVEAGP